MINSHGKPLLHFNVTPPKQNGPSEAERKLEALTRQLEEEMEKEEENEFFGKFLPVIISCSSERVPNPQRENMNSFGPF